uniref:Uncharacterized protein n=1 Tax=Gouania willdenowi TaxID=441366 RepID=A0A8C5H749_GOUWI
MDVPVSRLLLPVQRPLQNQLREPVPVGLRLHVQVEVVVGGDVVGAQCVRTHVRVKGALQGEPGPRGGALRNLHRDVGLRETGRVVVNVQHFNFDPKQLQRVLKEHLQVELTARPLPTDPLPVDLFVHKQNPVVQVQLQVRCARAGHDLEATGGQLGQVQSQVLRDVPHQGPVLCFLRD